jgi:hypothetical protein
MTKKEIKERAGRFSDLVEIGRMTANQIRVKGKRTSYAGTETNPVAKMYQVIAKLLNNQGVERVKGSSLSISDIVVTADTEAMIFEECRKWLKGKGYTKKRIDKEIAFAVLETPARVGRDISGEPDLEKAMGLKYGRVYVVRRELKRAQRATSSALAKRKASPTAASDANERK